MNRFIHPIEQESFAILRGRLAERHPDAASRPPLARAVLERVVHASADLEYADDLVLPEESVLASAVSALREGVPVVADVAMVAAGITRRESICRITDPRAAQLAKEAAITRSAAALRLAAEAAGPGAIYVVGCAPTALFELIEHAETYRPLLVLGLPVGFVGAVESKQALRESGLAAVSNISGKGGSAVAAAALNALLYWERGEAADEGDEADEDAVDDGVVPEAEATGRLRVGADGVESGSSGAERGRTRLPNVNVGGVVA